jgi:hypothetical protein
MTTFKALKEVELAVRREIQRRINKRCNLHRQAQQFLSLAHDAHKRGFTALASVYEGSAYRLIELAEREVV